MFRWLPWRKARDDDREVDLEANDNPEERKVDRQDEGEEKVDGGVYGR